ncbi:hypothetical protein J5N97_017495 [Dioscorea zingiberensis]|uniref:Uncharacterized protein n=1 Tax=Dioscorea zingiberensis TaxID=325984 RepID=A0A9D5CLS8_9LILI|nr:hypothetical protein J5N97_017495 [Dioscorea zingiberensis]
MWGAEPEVWQHLIEARPEAAEWMNKSVRNYDKLVQLYGQDRATGQHAETASEIRQRRDQNTVDTPSHGNTIDEIDLLVSQNTTNLEDLGENAVEDETLPTNQQSQSNIPSSSKSKKSKGYDTHDDISMFSTSLDKLASVMMQSTNAMIEASHINTNILAASFGNKDPSKGVDVWAMLTELGIPQPFLGEAYRFLIEQPKKLEGLIRCPNEHRKDLLLSWMRRDHDRGN